MNRRRAGWGRWIPLALGLAAAAVVLLGGGGRARTRRQRLAGAVRHSIRRTARTGRHLQTELYGAVERATHRPDAPADDLTLLDRVESVLFEDPSIPKGSLNLEVVNGVLFLRGELASRAEIERVAIAAAEIPGVNAITNLLHVPGTPAPNKEAALAARPRRSAGHRLSARHPSRR